MTLSELKVGQEVENDWGEYGVVVERTDDGAWIEHDYGTFFYSEQEVS